MPLEGVENSSYNLSSDLNSRDKETCNMSVYSRKRERSIKEKDNEAPKKSRMDVNIINNDNQVLSGDLQDEPRHDESYNTCQIKQYIPHPLFGLMYQLDLSILCSLRKLKHKYKYPSLSLVFEASEIDKFNVVLRHEEMSIYIHIESVDKYYVDNEITYSKLFTKGKQSFFSVSNYFNSFVMHRNFKLDGSSNNIEHFVIYTNAYLGVTEEKQLKPGRSKNFYPFKFNSINIDECDILKDFLFTNDNTKGRDFYQFSQDKITRKELLKRLEFSSAVQNVIKERKLSQEFQKDMKEDFLDKLVFAVNQPIREELNSIIKTELENNSKALYNYTVMQETILQDLVSKEEHDKLGNYISKIKYEFNLLMLFLHDMFLHKNISSINSKCHDVNNAITIHHKDKFTYVNAHITNSNIGYSQLFPSKRQERNSPISINRHFAFFIQEKDIEHFMIYINTELCLTEEKTLIKEQSKDFYPLKFECIDIEKKRYKILKKCSCINANNLYQFSHEETTRKKLFSLLKLPSSLQKEKEEGRFSDESENEIKERFLDKLIFAVNQLNKEELRGVIRHKIDGSHNVSYNYEELYEIALRWSESHEFRQITREAMTKLLEDIKNNRSSYQEIQDKNIDKEIKFARSVVGREGTPTFHQFLNFLIEGEGITYLAVLKRNGINLANMSGILNRAGTNALRAFKDLYDLWFDLEGNKTKYLKTLEKEGINLANMSSILNRARAKATQAFKNLYDLWFDEQGNKTQYLKTLEREQVNLVNMSSILNGAGAHAPKAFKDLYDLWFDVEGNKTQYLKTLEKKKINIANMSSILNGAGANAPKAFKDLYDLWFDGQGHKTQYLKTLEKEEVNLVNMSNILNGVGTNAPKAFKDLYDLWFDVKGNRTQYLKNLEKNRIGLASISSFLSRAGANAPKAFKILYNIWLDAEGNKTPCLITLENEGINLTNMSSILGGAGTNAPKAFKDLYNLWFDVEGNKTQYLKTLEKDGINLANMSSILHGAGTNAPKAFKDLYDYWFDTEGNKSQYLKILNENKINLTNVSSILGGAGTSAPKAFKDLCELWFDLKGNKSQYLKTLEKEGINVANMSSILHGAGTNASKAFRNLYDLWFDEEGNKTQYLNSLEREGINLVNMSSMSNGAGSNAAKVFKESYNIFLDDEGNKTLSLKHFIENKDEEKRFAIHNLSCILSGAGPNIKDAFEKLHSVCFNDRGKRTKLLNDFYKAGFRPRHLSSALCRSGVHSSSSLKRLHSICFDDEGKRKKLLNDFYRVGFRPGDLCSMLSSAVDCLEKFHDFCFKGVTKKYLNDFLNDTDNFTLSNLSEILHGAGANICSALKNFHDVCFDGNGNKTKLLNDFYVVGFRPNDLSSILSMAGHNATSILKNFHKLYFNKENYFNRYVAEENIFTPQNLSKILHRVGLNICPAFEKLHNFCFDKAGNNTNYLNNLIKNVSPNAILDILYKKVESVKQARSTFFDSQNISLAE